MVDALDVQQVERLVHGVRAALLPRVRDQPQAHVRGGQRDVVARRQPDQQLRLERAFDVQVQLSDGKHA